MTRKRIIKPKASKKQPYELADSTVIHPTKGFRRISSKRRKANMENYFRKLNILFGRMTF